MAHIVRLDPTDVLLVQYAVALEEEDISALATLKKLLGIAAVMVFPAGAELSSLSADEVLRAVAGP